MNTTKNVTWSVGRKLGAGFSAMVFLAIVIGVVGLVAMNTVAQEVKNSTVQSDIVGLADQINIDLLEARRAERNFFLEYKQLGIEQAKNLYAPEVETFITAVQTNADEGGRLAQIAENRARFDQIKLALNEYKRNFQAVVDLTEKRGYRTTGMEKQLIQKADDIEAIVSTLSMDKLMIQVKTIRGYSKDYRLFSDKADLQKLLDTTGQFKQMVTDLPTNQISGDDKATLLKLADEFGNLATEFGQVDTQFNEAINQNKKVVDDVDKLVKDIRQVADQLYDEAIANTDQTITAASTLEFVVLGLAVLVGIVIAFGLSRNISRPLSSLNEAVLAFANGNLSRRVEVSSNDELGVLADGFNQMTNNIQNLVEAERKAKTYLENTVKEYVAFVGQVANGNLATRLILSENKDPMTVLGYNLNQMVVNLSELTSQIREATANISSASSEILAATMQQVSGTNEQSAAITQTTSTITEVKTIVEQAFNKAEMVAQKAQRSNEISQSGQKAVTETVEGMNQIKEKVAGIAENILALSEQTQRIGEITATVNEIAAQSNLLALNASVEAARAGEHGKGFAVVPVEVRNLAEQSKQATAQVKTILNEIQKATNAAVMATEEGTKGVDVGVMLTHETGNTITILSQSITENSNAAQQIVASSKQQSAGMEQISLAMQNINQATIQNLASTRQTERSAQDLSSVAKQLDSLVARYKLN